MPPSPASVHEIPYGIHQGRTRHISEVGSDQRGLRCECACPICGHSLEAKLGEQRRHHFAHTRHAECDGAHAGESGIHLRAKEILAEHKRATLPELTVSAERRVGDQIARASDCLVESGQTVAFDTVAIEQGQGHFRPDVVGQRQQRRLFIEVCVRHPVSPEKTELIREAGVSCIEIDLSHLPTMATPAEIEAALYEASNARWVFHAKAQLTQAALYNGLQGKVDALQAGVDAQARAAAEGQARQEENRQVIDHLASQCADRIGELGKMLLPHCHFTTSKGQEVLPARLWQGLTVTQHNKQSRITALKYRSPGSPYTEQLWVYWSHPTLDDNPPKALADFTTTDFPICTIEIIPLSAAIEPLTDESAQTGLIDGFLLGESDTAQRCLTDQWLNTPKVLAPTIKLQQQDDRARQAQARQATHEAAKDEKSAAYLAAATTRTTALQEGEAALREVVHAANVRREAIETVRDGGGGTLEARWANIPLPASIELVPLSVLAGGAIEHHLKTLMFPYSHEASFAAHPDYVKVSLLDTVISQYGRPPADGGRFVIDVERLQETYHRVLSGLTPENALPEHLGASTLCVEWNVQVERLRALAGKPVMHGIGFLNVPTPDGLVAARDSLLAFIDQHHVGDSALTPPHHPEVAKMFLWLWCQDLGRIGIISDAPTWEEWVPLSTLAFKVDHLMSSS